MAGMGGRACWEGARETSWEDTVGVHAILRVVPLRSRGEGDTALRGTVNDYGECHQPYRCLASWEEPWRAEGGSRTNHMKELLANMERGLPVVIVSISECWDKFQTYRRGQVRCWHKRTEVECILGPFMSTCLSIDDLVLM